MTFESLNKEADVIKFVQTHPDAQMPTKGRENDVCYDLSIVDVVLHIDNFVMFDTGIAVQAPSGYFFKVHPRSSLYKSGLILSNSTGIIDPDYRGSLRAGFWIEHYQNLFEAKFTNFGTDDYQVLRKLKVIKPYRCLQLELCRLHPDFQWVQVEKLEETIRGENGFGSSGFN